MRTKRAVGLAGVAVALGSPWAALGAPAVGGGWTPTWSDEFNAGAADLAGWTRETGGGGWGNHEYETYTSTAANAYVANGSLTVAAVATATGSGLTYTSARLTTENVFAQRYGLIEFRAALPAAMAAEGTGLWPAVWMMPESTFNTSTHSYGPWPTSGEVDILESSSRTFAQGSLHSGASAGSLVNSTGYYAPANFDATQFHTYDLQWDAPSAPGKTGAIRWFVDGNLYQTQTGGWYSPVGSTDPEAPFDQPFALIINLAVGGDYVGGAPHVAAGTYALQVDYVRAYAAAVPEPTSLAMAAAVAGGWAVGRRHRRGDPSKAAR